MRPGDLISGPTSNPPSPLKSSFVMWYGNWRPSPEWLEENSHFICTLRTMCHRIGLGHERETKPDERPIRDLCTESVRRLTLQGKTGKSGMDSCMAFTGSRHDPPCLHLPHFYMLEAFPFFRIHWLLSHMLSSRCKWYNLQLIVVWYTTDTKDTG